MPSYFLITSYGRTATVWLANYLAQFDCMGVAHGPMPIPINSPDAPDTSPKAQHEFLKSFGELSLREYFAKLEEACPGRLVYGSVHAFTVQSLSVRHQRKERDSPNFKNLNLTRHPIHRIQSFVNRWTHELKISPEYHRKSNIEYSESALGEFFSKNFFARTPDTEDPIWLFLRAVFDVLNNDKFEYSLPNIQHIEMERYTQDRESLDWIAHGISSGIVKSLDSVPYLQAMNESSSFKGNSKDSSNSTSREIWDSWNHTKKQIFKTMAELLQVELTMYSRFKYLLDFVY